MRILNININTILVLSVSLLFAAPLAAQAATPAGAVVAASRKGMQIIELSQPLTARATFYPAMFAGKDGSALPDQPRRAMEFSRKIFPGGSPFGMDPASGGKGPSFTTGEHTGTHMDAPNHFIGSGCDIAGHPVSKLAAPIVVVDVRTEARADEKFPVSSALLREWEAKNGRIPRGAMVCLLTGCERQAGDTNTHHPGFTAEAADFMRNERDIAGVGTDALSPDISGALSFPVHKRLLGDSCMILENLRNLDSVPPNGAHVLMAPMPIVAGSGSPSRVMALVGNVAPGDYTAMDLTFKLDENTPYVDGEAPMFLPPEKPLLGELGNEVVKGIGKGFGLKIPDLGNKPRGTARAVHRESTTRREISGYYGGYFEMGMSTGTHVDFPRASESGGADATTYPAARLFGGAVVVDLRQQPPGAAVTAADLEKALSGTDLSGAFLVLWTGRDGRGHPGVSADAATWAMSRSARGVLSDAPAIDPSGASDRPAARAVHQMRGITGGFLSDPGRLPARGAVLAVLPLPIANSASAPARVLAYLPRR